MVWWPTGTLTHTHGPDVQSCRTHNICTWPHKQAKHLHYQIIYSYSLINYRYEHGMIYEVALVSVLFGVCIHERVKYFIFV